MSGKAFDKLKGQLYLEGCQIRDADPTTERENSFVITNSSGKEYIFTPPIDKEECTMWKNAIFYALKKVKIFADNLSVSFKSILCVPDLERQYFWYLSCFRDGSDPLVHF